MWHQSIFRSIVPSHPLFGQGFSPPQQPAHAADPVSQDNIRSLQPQRWIYYPLLHSLHFLPFFFSSSRLFLLFIFNPADVPHAWRRQGRRTDTVNQRGRGRARFRKKLLPPLKKKRHVTCQMAPGTAQRQCKKKKKPYWHRVGKHNLPHVDPTSFCQLVFAMSFSLKRPLICPSREKKSYISTSHHSAAALGCRKL